MLRHRLMQVEREGGSDFAVQVTNVWYSCKASHLVTTEASVSVPTRPYSWVWLSQMTSYWMKINELQNLIQI